MEDLHWADEATLDLLRFVGRRIDGTPSVLLGSMRDDEVGADHPLRAVLGDLATTGLVRWRIEPSVGRRAWSASRSGHEVDPVGAASRNRRQPVLRDRGPRAARMPALPPTVRDAVLTRVQRLPVGARDLLETVSVEPGSVGRALIRARSASTTAQSTTRCARPCWSTMVAACVSATSSPVWRSRRASRRQRARELHRRLLVGARSRSGARIRRGWPITPRAPMTARPACSGRERRRTRRSGRARNRQAVAHYAGRGRAPRPPRAGRCRRVSWLARPTRSSPSTSLARAVEAFSRSGYRAARGRG